jgi:hypothetical protein
MVPLLVDLARLPAIMHMGDCDLHQQGDVSSGARAEDLDTEQTDDVQVDETVDQDARDGTGTDSIEREECDAKAGSSQRLALLSSALEAGCINETEFGHLSDMPQLPLPPACMSDTVKNAQRQALGGRLAQARCLIALALANTAQYEGSRALLVEYDALEPVVGWLHASATMTTRAGGNVLGTLSTVELQRHACATVANLCALPKDTASAKVTGIFTSGPSDSSCRSPTSGAGNNSASMKSSTPVAGYRSSSGNNRSNTGSGTPLRAHSSQLLDEYTQGLIDAQLMAAGVLKPLLLLATSYDYETRLHVSAALASLCCHKSNRLRIVNAGGLEAVVSLASHSQEWL